MDNLNLISNFAEFKELKNIDKATICLLYTSDAADD